MSTDNSEFKSMFSGFMDNAKKMQDQFAAVYQDLAKKHTEITVEGTAGGDLVCVTANLKMEVVRIAFGPGLMAEKPEVISELIMAAVNSALSKAQNKLKEEMLAMGKKMAFPPNMKLPFGGE